MSRSRCVKLLERARRSPTSLTLREALYLADCHGYELRRIRGGHHMLRKRGALGFTLSEDERGVPVYQIKQMLERIDAHGEGSTHDQFE